MGEPSTIRCPHDYDPRMVLKEVGKWAWPAIGWGNLDSANLASKDQANETYNAWQKQKKTGIFTIGFLAIDIVRDTIFPGTTPSI